ncbi:MAG: hypothetical protein GY856_40560 [bacterium]|nr:hypothetical protein [bacterium]
MFANERRWGLIRFLFLAMLAFVVTGFADAASPTPATSAGGTAEEDAAEKEDSAASGTVQDVTGSSEPAGPLAKLSVHGYLTQAWATANFVNVPVVPEGGVGLGGQRPGEPISPSPRREEVSLGIPEDGTTNYRFLALQFRYDVSERDTVVIQFSSRSLGFSPLQDLEDDIELDWAFYGRRIGNNTSLKIGRILIPMGIYNEVRDVGTLLPFYRPAFVFYRERAFTSETLDGLSIHHAFFADSDWEIDVTCVAGEWESINVPIYDPTSSMIRRNEDGFGVQVWLNSPISGLRFGAGVLSFEDMREAFRRDISHASIDGSFDRFTFQAEWNRDDGLSVEVDTYYVLTGVRITERLKIWAQMERGVVEFTFPFLLFPTKINFREDIGISLNFFFSPNLVLKAEHHSVEEEDIVGFPDFSAGSFKLRPEVLLVPDGSYTILALSVSF